MTHRPMALLLASVLAAGCAGPSEPIERAKNDMRELIVPVMEKAIAELSVRTGQIQGQGSLVEPGYEFDGTFMIGTGAQWKGTLRVRGVSANLTGAAQADADVRPEAAP